MNLLKEKYYQNRLSKEAIEDAFEKAQVEIEQESYSKGLMAMAKSKSSNNISEAEALYLELRAEQILKNKIEEKRNKFYEEGKDSSAFSIKSTSDRIALLIFILAILVLVAVIISNIDM